MGGQPGSVHMMHAARSNRHLALHNFPILEVYKLISCKVMVANMRCRNLQTCRSNADIHRPSNTWWCLHTKLDAFWMHEMLLASLRMSRHCNNNDNGKQFKVQTQAEIIAIVVYGHKHPYPDPNTQKTQKLKSNSAAGHATL